MRRFLLFLLLLPMVLQAQKVTLVMSGGGAKGLAHIGVLKALEEENIPVNFIAGTSMGGVVAGCYAAGFSADEVEGLVSSPAFIRWVNGEVEPQYNYFFYSDDPTPSVLDVEFRLDSSMHASLASNLASDLSLNFALAEIFAQPSQIAHNNFDSLYIPVRIMASDVFTQSEIVLKSGSLASAIRSTLSVPFFYQPIRFDGKYLFDGGIYNNFPVDVAISEFDSDVIIGVNVASKIFEEYPYDKDDELLNRSMLFMFLDKSDPSAIPANGIYIEPNLTGYTAFDFKQAKSLIDSGYVAAKRMMPEIKEKISDRISTIERKRLRKEFWSRNVPLSFSGIDYFGFNDHQKKYLDRLFKTDRRESSDFLEVKKSYFEMMSEPYLQSIYPDIHFDDETNNYRLELHDRPHSNLNLHLGGVIASRNISQVYLGADHFYFDRYLIRTSMNFYAGNFHKSAQLKSRFMLSNFYPVYIEPGVTFNTWDYLDNDDLFFKNQEATVVERVDRKYGLNIGFPVTAKYKGVIHGSYFNNEDNYAGPGEILPSDTLNYLQLDGLRAGFLLSRDELNRRQYPNEGIAMKAYFDYFSVDENYLPGSNMEGAVPMIATHRFFRIGASLEQYFRRGKYSTGYLVQGVFSNQPLFSDKEGSVINAPAFLPLTDSKTLILQNLVGFNYVAGGWRNVFTLSDLFEFRLEGYTFKSFDGMRAPDEQLPSSSRFDRGFKFAATAGVVMHSPFGPVSFSANYYDDEENQFGVLLHLGYLLFNRSSWE